jgi:hypothetical protein
MTTEALLVKPPLPPPSCHDEIPFIVGTPTEKVSPETIVAIGFALTSLLPPGNLYVSPSGEIVTHEAAATAWEVMGRLEGTLRSSL